MTVRYLTALVCCLLVTPIFSIEEEPREDLFLSTPEQVAALTSEPSYLVGGLISPLSGQLVLRQTDLVVKGAQNIILSRTYTPLYMPCWFPQHKHDQAEHDAKYLYVYLRDHYKGWQFYPHLRLELDPHLMEVRLSEPSGMTIEFRLSGPGFSTTSLSSSSYAMSNLAGEIPSGQYDPRNTRISYEKDGNKIVVHATDGTTRVYCKRGWATHASYLYLLEKEILSNGKILKYHYNEKNHLQYIESLDPKERYVYASLRISGTPWDGSCHFTSSSDLMVDYNYQKKPIQWRLKEKLPKGKTHKEKGNCICPPILTSVNSPSYRHESLGYCGRFLLNSYSGKEETFNAFNGEFGEGSKHYRVHKLSLPVGLNDAFIPVYEMSYNIPIAGQREGITTVRDADGTSIVYHFSKNLLTTLIQYFGQDSSLKKEKIFSWNEQNWLESLEMRDSQHNLFYRRSYEYDRFGNPILETLTGDLTGEGNQETFITKRAFSEDGRNLLLKEETEDGKVICFSYLRDTNLITSKLTKEGDKIILRDFSVYDNCHNLVQKISDDGSSEERDNLSHVAQRTLITYTLRMSAPFLHMPEWIHETYWEAGTEKSLKKSHLIYDQHGNIAEEEVYDAEGRHAYTICKTYNERGDVLSETNRLEQQAVYTYDLRGRPETLTNFSNRIQKKLFYDTKGRLKVQMEKGDDGIVHLTSSEYDFHGRKLQKKDPFSNTTYYAYDPLVDQVIKTDFPPIASIDGQPIPVSTLSSYDSFGRELTKTDANGNLTAYRYNVYGSPTEIVYPNGGQETFRYAKNGQLICHTNLDGLMLYYNRDVLGRVLSKTYISADGKTLAEETFTYNGFNLLTEVDKEGNIKEYSHDGAGRKIREDFYGQVTDFSYDSLGYLETTCKYNGDNTLLIHYKRDLEGQVLEEHTTDTSGYTLHKIRYSYDGNGNQDTITRYINGNEAIETFVYDSFRRHIQYTDAEGYLSKTTYNENFTNFLNQRVLQITTLDPRYVTTIETQDALTRTVRAEVLSSHGTILSCQEIIHDPQGNLLYRRDHVYENDHLRNIQTVKYSYTTDHQIETLTRAFGTKDSRTTTYTYLSSGKRATKTLPDGVTLVYTYHPLGFTSHLDSSDGKIHQIFEYNKLGHLRYASDENQNTAIERQVDPFGNVTHEIFPSGLEVKKDYDDFNRLISLRMKGQGEVLYNYDPLFLREVTRVSSRGETLYSHTYENYDWDGNLVSESLIGNLSRVIHLTEPRRQKASIFSPYFSQQCTYDSVGNLIISVIDRAEHKYSYDGTSQLSSERIPGQSIAYLHDSLYNRIQKNGKTHEVNDLNEFLSSEETRCSYDFNGNQILNETASETSHLSYDPLGQLIEVISKKKKINFSYDPLGRRLSKVVYTPTAYGWKEASHEHYLYNDQNEIGAFNILNEPKNLRVLGLASHKDNPTTIGIEIGSQVFAPLLDVQGNIRRLIDLDTRVIEESYGFTAFGEELQNSSKDTLNPWRFASKRLDSELGLIYFGKRYYDPRLGRWLSTDPVGFIDSFNLYQYVLNNPFRYQDPRGENLAGFLCGIAQIVAGGAIMASGVAIEIATCGGYTFAIGFHEAAGLALMTSGYAQAMGNVKDVSSKGGSHSRSYDDDSSKRHTSDQEAISELVKESGKKGVSNEDADTLLEWAKEYDFPARDDRGKLNEQGRPHWEGGEHIHLGPKHVKVK